MNKKVVKEIQRISTEIPKEISENLMMWVPANPAITETIELGLKDPDTTPELRKKLEMVKNSGLLNEMMETIDPEVEKKLDEWWSNALEQAIKEGRIPKPKEGDDSLSKLIKKGKRNVKRNNKRVEGTSGEGDIQAE